MTLENAVGAAQFGERLQNLMTCRKVKAPELLDGIGEGKTIGFGHQGVIEVVLLFQDHELLDFAASMRLSALIMRVMTSSRATRLLWSRRLNLVSIFIV